MFTEQRHRQILDKLESDGKVLVKELAAQFNLSEDSIRKDLQTLESEGLLKRTYGGAISLQEKLLMTEANKRRVTSVEHKRNIAAAACQLVRQNQLLFLDISSISIAVADLLEGVAFPLRVITPMIDVLAILAKNPHIQIFFAGGQINQSRDGFCDSLAVDFLRRFAPDVAFISPFAIVGEDVCSRDVNSGLAKQAVIARADKSYLLAEADKFNRRAHFHFATVADFAAIISDVQLPHSPIPILPPLRSR